MNLNQDSQSIILNVIRDAARDIIMPHFRHLDADQIASKSSQLDLVTVADQACERYITEKIAEKFPNWTIVGEEAVAESPELLKNIETADTCMIIDPIDGTWNFANGLSDFGVIIAVVVKGVTVFGLLYDPVHDDYVYANKGEGAFLVRPNSDPIKLSIEPELDLKKMLGILSFYSYGPEMNRHLAVKSTAFARIHSLPSCHAYRQLAIGHFNFGLYLKMNPWDHAAGVLILQEAGGYCQLLNGSDYSATMENGKLLVAQSEEQWHKLADWFEIEP
ncbi:inositol monophosphatase family protein [Marinomonas balearica]|uniref:Fructose-1,6-bisphosphatase/inositol monophosphatase family enzyme n=1 Tax=Marinomonas balearica TaxID=491947 RepID=A0A4R6MBG4_9GAMM|nr:inositol monophosphatase [Marinomonas balearica]TDO98947.1 fructose-1,6-bisphosphatase/inositol monophosphatase family enzyme [Marinomonas balearica]